MNAARTSHENTCSSAFPVCVVEGDGGPAFRRFLLGGLKTGSPVLPGSACFGPGRVVSLARFCHWARAVAVHVLWAPGGAVERSPPLHAEAALD